jgi:valyl-tRNA synthetase
MAYDQKTIEAKWQDWWEKEKVFHFDFDTKRPIYSIDNPPRYANAALHLGHATSYTHIDFAARYRRLRGFEVYFPLCADVNGMPIEKAVEKKFGVDKHSTDRQTLIKMCRDFANANIAEMTRQFKILGHCMDPSIYYQTDEPYYRRITQVSFIRMFKRGLVYKAKQPITWCPSCGTALASAEVEYEERKTKLNFIHFFQEDGKPIEIATTRPELVCACQLVAVNPEDERWLHLIGKDLRTPIYDKQVRIVGDDNVLPEFGTGVVMVCTIGDKDDLEWIHRYDLPIEMGIDERGRMTALAGKYEGMDIKEARDAILKDLEDGGMLTKQEDLDQSVGACWRCHTAVEFLDVPQWFLKILDYRDKVMEMADKVHWFPEFMKERLRNWNDSLSWDWCVSRQRYFATPIPLWECEKEGCNGVVLAEEGQCYMDPTITEPPVDRCPDCGGGLAPCEDVFDTWMDSSLSALFCAFWERDEEKFKKLYPVNLRPQSHDIIRTWAFYTLVRTYLITEDIPWEDIVISGFIMAPDGRPMHTSLNNVIDPLPVLDEFGADAFRYFAGTCTLGRDQPFQQKEVVHGRRLAEKVYNIGKFIGGAIADYDGKPVPTKERSMVDRWILSRFGRTVEAATEALDQYAFDRATRALEQFIWHELADHYLELAKYRIYDKKDVSAKATLFELGQGIITILSFLQPHVTEDIYQEHFKRITGEKSVAFTSWPEAPAIDEEAEGLGEVVKDITAALRSFKSERGIALNAPMPKVQIVSDLDISSMLVDIKRTTNATEVVMTEEGQLEETPAGFKPVKSKIGPEFKAKAGKVMAALKDMDRAGMAELARSLEKGSASLRLDDGEEVNIRPDHVEMVRAWSIKGKDVDLMRVEGATVLIEKEG